MLVYRRVTIDPNFLGHPSTPQKSIPLTGHLHAFSRDDDTAASWHLWRVGPLEFVVFAMSNEKQHMRK